jgi:hypothetical protein
VTRRRSLTNEFYRAARLSNDMRAASRGPEAYAKRRVRRRAYRAGGGVTRSILRAFKLSR